MGGIGDVCQVVGVGIQIRSQRTAGSAQQVVVLAPQKENRLTFQAALPCLVVFEHGYRNGAERAVIEEDDIGIEKKFVFEGVHAVIIKRKCKSILKTALTLSKYLAIML